MDRDPHFKSRSLYKTVANEEMGRKFLFIGDRRHLPLLHEWKCVFNQFIDKGVGPSTNQSPIDTDRRPLLVSSNKEAYKSKTN